MIAVIIGKKTPAFTKIYEDQISKLGKNAGVEKIELSAETISEFFDSLQTPSLFGDRKVFVVQNIFEDEDVKKDFLERLKNVSDCAHDMIITADSILAPDIKKLEKFAEVYKVAVKEIKEQKLNPFALADAFASGDRKKSWIVFQQVAAQSDEMEMTHGMVWWKLKDMMTKRSIFSDAQLRTMAQTLVDAYHQSRLGGLGIGDRLEKFFLTLPNTKK